MMKKILIVYATAGIGHKKAAIAIKKAFDEIGSEDMEVSIIDSLEYTNGFFKWIYLNIYLLMVNKFPILWGLLYYLTDNFYFNLAITKIRRLNNWLNSWRLVNYLLSLDPDVVISTHFFATEVVSDLKRKNALKSHLITVVTDYRLHAWWVSDFVDTYVVASQDAKDDLIRWRLEPSKIKVLGIPVEPIFSKSLDRIKILEENGLEEDAFTILVIGGGFGVGPIEEIVRAIDGIDKEIQLIVICGHNEELCRKMGVFRTGLKLKIKVLGFVDNVYDYMEISSLLISKAGGITVTESLARELPMIIISPIIGQETRNSDFLIRQGAALRVDRPSDLKKILEDIILNPARLERMKDSIRRIKAPRAAYDIAGVAMEKCKKAV